MALLCGGFLNSPRTNDTEKIEASYVAGIGVLRLLAQSPRRPDSSLRMTTWEEGVYFSLRSAKC